MLWRPLGRGSYVSVHRGESIQLPTRGTGGIMRTIVSAMAGLLLAFSAASADPVGRYTASGTDAQTGNPYSGVVTVQRTGDTYRVTWVVGGVQYDGTGIGNNDFIAVSYRAGNVTGLALYGAKGDKWEGIWAYAGGRRLGTEVWERR